MKNKLSPFHNDEIDLIEIFKILYLDKWIIIATTIIFIVIGVLYGNSRQNNYQISIEFFKAPDSNFFKYLSLKDSFREHENILYSPVSNLEFDYSALYKNTNLDSYTISADSVFDSFITELKNTNSIEHIVKSYLNETASYEKVVSIANSFSLSYLDDKNKIAKISFNHSNSKEINTIANYLMENILIKVKKKIIDELYNLANYTSEAKKRANNAISQKISYLSYEIDNFNMNSNFKSNNEFVQSMIVSHNLILLNLTLKLKQIENLDTVYQIEKISEEFSNEEHSNMIIYNLSSSEIKDLNLNRQLIFIIFGFVGFLISSIITVIANVLRNQKANS